MPGGDDGRVMDKKGLAKQLQSSVVAIIAAGLGLVLAIYVVSTMNNVPDWGMETKDAMIQLELRNIQRLASDKAAHTAMIFGRQKEVLLQLQAFGEQTLLTNPKTMMVVDNYISSFSGLLQRTEDWNHSAW